MKIGCHGYALSLQQQIVHDSSPCARRQVRAINARRGTLVGVMRQWTHRSVAFSTVRFLVTPRAESQ
jgi:hypothetical protein